MRKLPALSAIVCCVRRSGPRVTITVATIARDESSTTRPRITSAVVSCASRQAALNSSTSSPVEKMRAQERTYLRRDSVDEIIPAISTGGQGCSFGRWRCSAEQPGHEALTTNGEKPLTRKYRVALSKCQVVPAKKALSRTLFSPTTLLHDSLVRCVLAFASGKR